MRPVSSCVAARRSTRVDRQPLGSSIERTSSSPSPVSACSPAPDAARQRRRLRAWLRRATPTTWRTACAAVAPATNPTTPSVLPNCLRTALAPRNSRQVERRLRGGMLEASTTYSRSGSSDVDHFHGDFTMAPSRHEHSDLPNRRSQSADSARRRRSRTRRGAATAAPNHTPERRPHNRCNAHISASPRFAAEAVSTGSSGDASRRNGERLRSSSGADDALV